MCDPGVVYKDVKSAAGGSDLPENGTYSFGGAHISGEFRAGASSRQNLLFQRFQLIC